MYYKDIEVTTTLDLANYLGVDFHYIISNFHSNKTRFILDADYHLIFGDEKDVFVNKYNINARYSNSMYVWTKSGVVKHKALIDIAKEKDEQVAWENSQNSSEELVIEMGEVAKLLYSDLKIGRNRLFDQLRTYGILMRNNVPYQEYIEREYFTLIEVTTPQNQEVLKTMVTKKGIKFIKKLLGGNNGEKD
jgi:phage antirepressor YoqD-like protein